MTWDGGCVTGRVNAVTGEMIDVDPPIWLHSEDVEWCFNVWAEYDLLEYEIQLAVREKEMKTIKVKDWELGSLTKGTVITVSRNGKTAEFKVTDVTFTACDGGIGKVELELVPA